MPRKLPPALRRRADAVKQASKEGYNTFSSEGQARVAAILGEEPGSAGSSPPSEAPIWRKRR